MFNTFLITKKAWKQVVHSGPSFILGISHLSSSSTLRPETPQQKVKLSRSSQHILKQSKITGNKHHETHTRRRRECAVTKCTSGNKRSLQHTNQLQTYMPWLLWLLGLWRLTLRPSGLRLWTAALTQPAPRPRRWRRSGCSCRQDTSISNTLKDEQRCQWLSDRLRKLTKWIWEN